MTDEDYTAQRLTVAAERSAVTMDRISRQLDSADRRLRSIQSSVNVLAVICVLTATFVVTAPMIGILMAELLLLVMCGVGAIFLGVYAISQSGKDGGMRGRGRNVNIPKAR